jgi:Skp family chaperone for outer membrane proteins
VRRFPENGAVGGPAREIDAIDFRTRNVRPFLLGDIMRPVHVRCRLFTAFLVVALSLSGAAYAQSEPGRVAVVDTNKVFLQLDETKALQQKLDTQRQALEKEQADRTEALNAMKGRHENIKKGTPQYADDENKILMATLDLQVWTELQKAKHERSMKLQMKSLLDKIQSSVADIATQRGYNLVLARQAAEIPKDLDTLSIDQLQGLIARQNVLFVAKGDDISDLVISDLNARHVAGK